ncbi:MAG: response regulator [bacterium]
MHSSRRSGLDAEHEGSREVPLQDRCRYLVLAPKNPAMLEFLTSALAKSGFEVIACHDWMELSSHLKKVLRRGPNRKVNVVVLDLQRSRAFSKDWLGFVRGIPAAVPVILITAFGDTQTYALALQSGARAVFCQPFELDELLRAVRETIPS